MSTIHGNRNTSRAVRKALCTETVILNIGVAITMAETSCGWSTSYMNAKLQINQTLDSKIPPNPKVIIKLQNKETIT